MISGLAGDNSSPIMQYKRTERETDRRSGDRASGRAAGRKLFTAIVQSVSAMIFFPFSFEKPKQNPQTVALPEYE